MQMQSPSSQECTPNVCLSASAGLHADVCAIVLSKGWKIRFRKTLVTKFEWEWSSLSPCVPQREVQVYT